MYEIVIGRSESDLKRLGLKGTIFLGKHYVKMGPTTSLSNKIMMDVARAHVVLVSGKRGSGKCIKPNSKVLLDCGLDVASQGKEKFGYDKLMGIFRSSASDVPTMRSWCLGRLYLRSYAYGIGHLGGDDDRFDYVSDRLVGIVN